MRKHSPKTTAFTLIEILICMAIFAVGFAAVAALLPAGLVLEKQIKGNTDAAITGRNALEVMKGKGMHALTCELVIQQGRGWTRESSGVSTVFTGAAATDMESAAKSVGQGRSGFLSLGKFWDTDADNMIWSNAYGYSNARSHDWEFLTDAGDFTNWSNGRIHALKNRPVPGVTPSCYSLLDFSYPSSVLDINARTYVSHVLYGNQSTTKSADLRYQDPSTENWLLTAITVRSGDDNQTWPEQVEQDPSAPAGPTGPYKMIDSSTSTPKNLYSNQPYDFRSQTGGDPGNGNATLRGYCGGYYADLRINLPSYNYWNFYGYANLISVPKAGSNGTYTIPVPMVVPALVYDKANDLILLRYPQIYAQNPVAGNTRVTNYRTANNITAASWIDRKLKKGDTFMTKQGGYVFQVKNLRDPVPAGLAAPGGSVDWSDGTYQLVQVTPSLSSTIFTANQKFIGNPGALESGNSEWQNPYLYEVIVTPAAVAGGANPWTATTQLVAGPPINPSATQKPIVFHPFANLAE